MTTELETVVMVIILKGKHFSSDDGLLSQYTVESSNIARPVTLRTTYVNETSNGT